MNVKDIANLDPESFSRMTRPELMKTANKLVSAVNKRISRLESSEFKDSGALEKLINSGKNRFSTAGQNRNQLLRTIKEAKAFYKAQSGSVSGQKKLIKETADRISSIGGKESGDSFKEYTESEENRRSFWRAYERAKDSAKINGSQFDSERVQKAIRKAMQIGIRDVEEISEFIDSIEDEYEDEFEGFEEEDFYEFSDDGEDLPY